LISKHLEHRWLVLIGADLDGTPTSLARISVFFFCADEQDTPYFWPFPLKNRQFIPLS
jgi:hypothetical protein